MRRAKGKKAKKAAKIVKRELGGADYAVSLWSKTLPAKPKRKKQH